MDVVDDSSELLITLTTTQRATNLVLTADELHVISIDTSSHHSSGYVCKRVRP
jgi:hypothetical protein